MIMREYQCKECGGIREFLETMNSPIERPCEADECGGLSYRIMSAPNVSSRRNGSTDAEYPSGGLVWSFIF